MNEEGVPPLDTFTEYRLTRYKNSLVALPFSPERSHVVELIDALLEVTRPGGEVRDDH